MTLPNQVIFGELDEGTKVLTTCRNQKGWCSALELIRVGHIPRSEGVQE